jgi:hypothetical protein
MGEPQRDMFPNWENPESINPKETLQRARPLPPVEDSVIENLTEDEERIFWETIIHA